MSFAAFAWLAGLAALVIPIAIHLWSRGIRRRVEIGSIRLLEALPGRRARRVRLTHPWLLLLRSVLLIALVLALASPRLEVPPPPSWVLIEPSTIGDLAASTVEAWRTDRAEIRLLAPGLPRWSSDAEPAVTPAASVDLWSYLREADLVAPLSVPFLVVTEARLSSVRGERPVMNRPVEAWSTKQEDESNRFLVAATGTSDTTEGRVIVGTSSTTGTTYQRSTPSMAGVRTDDGTATLSDGGVVSTDDSLAWTRGEVIEVVIHHESDRETDADFLAAAVATAAEALGREWVLSRQGTETPRSADVVAWLSASPVPETLRRESRVLISDALGDEARACWFSVTADGWNVGVRQCAAADRRSPESVVWLEGGRGEPFVDLTMIDRGAWLHLHGRFLSSWSDLVTTPILARWLTTQLEEPNPHVGSDRRRVEESVWLPRQRSVEPVGTVPSGRSLEASLWLLVFMLLLIERWVSVSHGAERTKASMERVP
ncbi:MAG: BatA domain-containing protein [Acidobacteriota bacterium]